MSDLYIEARLQAIKDIASASCTDEKDADNIASFCDEIYSAIPKLDKIIEELELHSFELGTDTLPAHYVRLNDAIEIVKQEAERCNSGWILCSERFPDECVPVNVTYINRNPEPYYAKIKDVPFSATAVYYNGKWYWYSSACVDYLTEYGKNDFDLVDKDIDIIAWMELPSAYIPKEK